MEKFKYKAINAKGRPQYGMLNAQNENDLFKQLQAAGLELVTAEALSVKKSKTSFLAAKVKIRDLIQYFIHLDQLESAAVPLLDALADIRDTTENPNLRDAVSEIYRDVTEGSKLSEAMEKHPKIFQKLYVSLIASGEETGKMRMSYQQLIKYLKWVDAMESRVRKATRYPLVLLVVVVLAVVVMMGFVVPQIVDFIRNMEFELPFPTVALIATSDFFRSYWYIVLATPVVFVALFFALRKASEDIAYRTDAMILEAPMFGSLIRKINIARFCQTFGALYGSGLPILQAMQNATNTVTNLALVEALETIQSHIKTGKTLSDSFNSSGEFPSLVIRMLKVGEDSGNLNGVLDQVSEFYTSDVDEEVQKLIAMIEPSLTVVLGGMILWIAVGVFGPIYGSFENMEF
jgi:type IV pilus assembly protein PilC